MSERQTMPPGSVKSEPKEKFKWVQRWWALPIRFIIMFTSIPLCLAAIILDVVRGIDLRQESRAMKRYLWWAVTGNTDYLA